jgi:uncharacterized damage-inducible protein DinB
MGTWTAPAVDRPRPSNVASQRESLEQWLDFHRATLLWKCSGLTGEQLTQAAVPTSALTLLGLVRHMTEVERWWFRLHGAGEDVPLRYCTDENDNGDFDDLDAADAAADLAAFEEECAASRAAVAGMDLDTAVTCTGHHHSSNTRDVRWLFVHMIEEYARHNGHADLLREAIDGATGD